MTRLRQPRSPHNETHHRRPRWRWHRRVRRDVAFSDDTARNEASEIVEAGGLGAFHIQVGDCVNGADAVFVQSVEGVPCAEPHGFETYAAFDLTEGEYPGEIVIAAAADEGCYAQFSAFVGRDYETSALDFVHLSPTHTSWTEQDDREVLCLLMDYTGGELTGSVRGWVSDDIRFVGSPRR